MSGCLLSAGQLNAYMAGLRSCFQRVADYKLDIFITPHVNDGSENSQVWRNAVRLDPLKTAGQWSYSGGAQLLQAGTCSQALQRSSATDTTLLPLHCIIPRSSCETGTAWVPSQHYHCMLHAALGRPPCTSPLPRQPHCTLNSPSDPHHTTSAYVSAAMQPPKAPARPLTRPCPCCRHPAAARGPAAQRRGLPRHEDLVLHAGRDERCCDEPPQAVHAAGAVPEAGSDQGGCSRSSAWLVQAGLRGAGHVMLCWDHCLSSRLQLCQVHFASAGQHACTGAAAACRRVLALARCNPLHAQVCHAL